MAVFISIVNHNHDEMIVNNPTLPSLSRAFTIVIKSNTQATQLLTRYCRKNNIHLLQEKTTKGFGANNNNVFQYVKAYFKPKPEDYFLVLNPDVELEVQSLSKLTKQAREYHADISAINLYKDRSLTTYDNSIRRYPSLLSPIKSVIGIPRNDIYDKNKINVPTKVEWAAGSFLLFRVNIFERLKGFDEKYFMYFEDVDICTRANKENFSVYYFPNIKAIHFASHQNRQLLSKHFIWYWRSSLMYQIRLHWEF